MQVQFAAEDVIDPRSVEAAKLVEAGLQLADPSTRIGTLKKALRAVPSHAPALNNIGASYFELGDYGRAESYFKKALESEPDMKGLLSNYGAAIIGTARRLAPGKRRRELLQAAEATLKDAVGMAPDDPAARWYVGVAQYHAGKLPDALSNLRAAMKKGPRADEVSPPGGPVGRPSPEELTRGLDKKKIIMLLASGDERKLAESPVELVIETLGRLTVERARIKTRLRDGLTKARVPHVRDPAYLNWLDGSWRGRSQAATLQALMGTMESDSAFGHRSTADEAAELREVAMRTIRAVTAMSVTTRSDGAQARDLRSAMGELFSRSAEMALVDAVAQRVLLIDAVYGGMHYVR